MTSSITQVINVCKKKSGFNKLFNLHIFDLHRAAIAMPTYIWSAYESESSFIFFCRVTYFDFTYVGSS